MDTYLERIIKKKYTAKEIILTIILYIAAAFLSGIVFIASFIHPLIMQFSLPISVGLFAGAWWLAQKFNVEYEYIVTNDELDVDRIVSRRSRKRMLTVSARKFDHFGKAYGEEEKFLKDPEIRVKLDASIGKNSEERYYAVFENKQSDRMLLIFNPKREMLEAFRRYNPNVVKIDE